jgi:hypothetical protein
MINTDLDFMKMKTELNVVNAFMCCGWSNDFIEDGAKAFCDKGYSSIDEVPDSFYADVMEVSLCDA